MDNELYHYGVLGMKWGVRKSRGGSSKSGGRRRSKTETVHEDYAKAHSKKSVKQMSDAELRSRINRLQMEKQYSQLNQRQVSAGEKFAKDILREVAKDTVKQYVTKGVKEGIGKGQSKIESRRYMKRNGTSF